MRTSLLRHRTPGAAYGCCRTRGAATARASGGGRQLCASCGARLHRLDRGTPRRCGARCKPTCSLRSQPPGDTKSAAGPPASVATRARNRCTAAALRRSRQRSARARHDRHTNGVELRVLKSAAGERLLVTHTTKCRAAHLLVTSCAAAHKAPSACATHTATQRRAVFTPEGGPCGLLRCDAVLQPATAAFSAGITRSARRERALYARRAPHCALIRAGAHAGWHGGQEKRRQGRPREVTWRAQSGARRVQRPLAPAARRLLQRSLQALTPVAMRA